MYKIKIAFGVILKTMRERETNPVTVHLLARMSGSSRKSLTPRFPDEDLIRHALLGEWPKGLTSVAKIFIRMIFSSELSFHIG